MVCLKPLAVSESLTISMVHLPIRRRASLCLSPAYPPSAKTWAQSWKAGHGSIRATAWCPAIDRTSAAPSRPAGHRAVASARASHRAAGGKWPRQSVAVANCAVSADATTEAIMAPSLPFLASQIAWQSQSRTGILRPSGIDPLR